MSLIEQAAKRLEELRRAGVSFPESSTKLGEASSAKALKEVLPGDNHPLPLSTRPPSHFVEKQTRDDAQRPIVRTTQAQAKDATVVECASSPQFDLNLAKLAANGFVTPDMPRSRIADEFRVLKRPLIGNVSGDRVVPIKHANLTDGTRASSSFQQTNDGHPNILVHAATVTRRNNNVRKEV